MSVAGLFVVYINIWLGLERGSGRANRKWCGHAGRLVVQQVVEGEGVYKCGAGGNYCCVLEGCLFPLSLWSSGFHDFLRLKPPSLFLLFGCISISITSLMRRSSAIRTQTTGNYPKRNKLRLEHGESLKTRRDFLFTIISRVYTIIEHRIKSYRTKKSQLVSLEFFIYIKSLRSHYGPGVDSACNRNEYQEHFLGA